jgi:carboxypeptidase C (cathepsin A)
MDETVQMQETSSDKLETPPDEPLLDTTPYGSGKDDSISDITENSAITRHTLAINGTSIPYTARAGHLVTTDLYSARPAAKIFYVAFTANVATPSSRPINKRNICFWTRYDVSGISRMYAR